MCVSVKWCFWGNTILRGFSKQKQSVHYAVFSLTTRLFFILIPLSVKTPGCDCPIGDSESFRCSYFCSPLSKPTPKRLPSVSPPPPALAQQRADHQAITRELGNREEIQSLKGLNTGRGSRWWRAEAPAAPRAEWDHWVWGGLVRGEVGVSYTKDLAGTDWVCVIVYMNTHLFTNTQSLHLRPDVLIHRAGFHSRILWHCFRVKALYF